MLTFHSVINFWLCCLYTKSYGCVVCFFFLYLLFFCCSGFWLLSGFRFSIKAWRKQVAQRLEMMSHSVTEHFPASMRPQCPCREEKRERRASGSLKQGNRVAIMGTGDRSCQTILIDCIKHKFGLICYIFCGKI